MILSARFLLCGVTTVALTVGGITYTHPDFARQAGRQLVDAATPESQDGDQNDKIQRINDRNDAVRHRIALKTDLARDLAEGRLSLQEAAQAYEDLNTQDSETQHFLEHQVAGATIRLKCARQAVSYVEAIYREKLDDLPPGRIEELQQELKALTAATK